MLEIINLSFKRKNNIIFKNINLKLDSGIYGLFGNISSGKTLFCNLINGDLLYKEGYILLENEIIYENDDNLDKIIYLNESYINFYNNSKTINNYYTYIDIYLNNFNYDNALELLNYFNLDLNSNIDKLSLGQRALVIGIISLAVNKKIIILDNIYNGMDYQTRKDFNIKIKERQQKLNNIFIISTELTEELKIIVDYTLEIKKSNIILKKYEGGL